MQGQALLIAISDHGNGGFGVLQRLVRLNRVPADLFNVRRQLFAKKTHMWLTQNMQVVEINLVDLNCTLTSLTPAHLWVIDIVVRLFRTLEQNHRSTKSRWSKVLGPVRLRPVGSPRFASRHCLDFVLGHALKKNQSLGEGQFLHLSQALAKIVNSPQPTPLVILQDPRVENRE